jgi:hypothetical protein
MHGRHLTQKFTLWVFQMRVPRRFFFLHSLSAIRFTIGLVVIPPAIKGLDE